MRTHARVPLAGGRATTAPTLGLRRMAVEDLTVVARLEAESFSVPWSPAAFLALLQRGDTELWVADRAGEGVIGYYVLWCVLDQAEVANIAVDPRVRGQRVGAALLDHALDLAAALGAESVFLEVRASNHAARALYTSRAFQPVGVRRNYYDHPREDAHLLVRHLNEDRP